jgi:hypothetical protein
MTTPDKKLSDQSKKFTQAAREFECDDDEVSFDDKLGKIARQKPADPPKPKKKKAE